METPTKRFPLATTLIACLIVIASALSLNQIIPDAKVFYLDAGLFQGASPWSPLTYWLFVDKAPSLILALLPLFLFGTTVERLVGRARLLLIFFGGVLAAAAVFALAFASEGKVLAANGALCGGASLCGAALLLSLFGRVPAQSSQTPLWLLCLLFMAGLVWTSLFVPSAIYENVAFRTVGFFVGVLFALLFVSRIPSPEGT